MKGRIDERENQLKSGMAVLNEDSVYNMIGVERPLELCSVNLTKDH